MIPAQHKYMCTLSTSLDVLQQDLLHRQCAEPAPSGEAGPSGDNFRHERCVRDVSDEDQPQIPHFPTVLHHEPSAFEEDDDSRRFQHNDEFRDFFLHDVTYEDEGTEQHAIVHDTSPQHQLAIHRQIAMQINNASPIRSAQTISPQRSPAQQQRATEQARLLRMQRHREQQPHVQLGAALDHTDSLMSGTIVIPLFRLGQRQPCTHCGALLFPHERSWGHLCCMKGQVMLPPLAEELTIPNSNGQDLQQQNAALKSIFELWKSNTIIAHTMRKYARQINNALAMASVTAASEVVPAHGTWKPSVVICGKVYTRLGSLVNTSTSSPAKFAQLWYHDPEHDQEHASVHRRLAHMRLPAHVTSEEVQHLHAILGHFEVALRLCNPYVRDFQMACELPTSQVEQSKLILHADPQRL